MRTTFVTAAAIAAFTGFAAHAENSDQVTIKIENSTKKILGAGVTQEQQGVDVAQTNSEMEPGQSSEIKFKIDKAGQADANLKVEMPIKGKDGADQSSLVIYYTFSGGKADCTYVITGNPGDILVYIYDCSGPAVRYVVQPEG